MLSKWKKNDLNEEARMESIKNQIREKKRRFKWESHHIIINIQLLCQLLFIDKQSSSNKEFNTCKAHKPVGKHE